MDSTTKLALCLGLLVGLPAWTACGGAADGRPTATEPAADGEDEYPVDRDEVERLRALGYVNVAPALPPDAKVGVVIHDEERASRGLTLFANAKFCSAQLIEMDGRVRHEWSYEPCFRWGNVVLADNGDLLIVGRLPHGKTPDDAREARYVMRQDWDGNILWQRELPVHHDVEQTPDGRILTLTYEFRLIPEVHGEIAVRDNAVALLDRDGKLLERAPLWDVLHSAPDLFTMQEGRERNFEGGMELDLFHANSIEWIRHPGLIGSQPFFGPNSVLVCVRNQDTLAIFDWKTKKLQWAWGQGKLVSPHDATLLHNGHILAFDNGHGRSWSRVVEVDPVARKIVWQYKAPEPESFYSGTRGANQRLANGNTLITESDDGRAFEVTPAGDIVWEFINPNMTEEREPSVIVRMRRFDGIDYEQLDEAIRSGRGLPMQVD